MLSRTLPIHLAAAAGLRLDLGDGPVDEVAVGLGVEPSPITFSTTAMAMLGDLLAQLLGGPAGCGFDVGRWPGR